LKVNSFSRIGIAPILSLSGQDSSSPNGNASASAGSQDKHEKLPLSSQTEPPEAVMPDVELDPLEEGIALEMEKEFGAPPMEDPDKPDQAGREQSGRLLDVQRKRELCAEMEDQIHQGSGLMGALAKQIGILGSYLEKTEVDLKRLEKVETNANKLRVASEGITRRNQEMKATVEEQKKRIALLEAKTSALRETNETARTNIARLLEEKRIATVDLAELQSEIAHLENDKKMMSEKLDVIDAEVRELAGNLEKSREREKAAVAESRSKDEELGRLGEELEELRNIKKQNAIDLEELRSRNSALEFKTAEQKSRIDELSFELDSGRKEFDEIIRLKQQRILELEARGNEASRHEVSDRDVPSIAFDPAKEREKATASRSDNKTKTAAKSSAKSTAKN
jgi:chromosome segregation ATPase